MKGWHVLSWAIKSCKLDTQPITSTARKQLHNELRESLNNLQYQSRGMRSGALLTKLPLRLLINVAFMVFLVDYVTFLENDDVKVSTLQAPSDICL